MSLHILPDLLQGTEEWMNQRRGMVTASAVGQLITAGSPDATTVACPACKVETGPCVSLARKHPTPLKLVHPDRASAANALPPVIEAADNETSRNLTFVLAAERIAGYTDPTFINADMFRGIDDEPRARDKYSETYAPVEEVGFMMRDDWGWELGYSPDGLVGDDGLIEVKAPRAKTHIKTVLADEVPAQHMAQLQCGLLVSGREWIDFLSYSGGLPMWRKRVFPDVMWFAAIEEAVTTFEANVARIIADFETATVGLPATERIELEMVI